MAKILIVDDEKSLRVTLQGFLVADGHNVDVASEALEAQRRLMAGNYDVVVTDLVMPGLSGGDLLKAIRASAPNAQIIVMTGVPTVDTAAEAVRAGASDYLTKPVPKAAILRSVATAARIGAVDEERRREQEAKERSQQELRSTVWRLSAANEKLRQAAAFREDVEQIARHDLKSPLSVILGVPALIKTAGSALSEEQLSLLRLIENAGQRLLDMINLSLDLFSMEQGMYTLRPESVDLLRVAQEVISHNGPLMRAKKLSAVIQIEGRPATATDAFVVPGEKLLCYSMLGNLFKNALEASPAGEPVNIRFTRGGGMSVSIHNRGAVPESVKDRFFEKFSTAGKEHGTGLGTYSAKMIAVIHGAQIEVDTSAPDFTTVTVCFPGAPAPAVSPAVP